MSMFLIFFVVFTWIFTVSEGKFFLSLNKKLKILRKKKDKC